METHNMPVLTDRRRNAIFCNLVVSGLASSTLATAMTTALPNLAADFGVSTAVGQWVTSGYSLAMGVVMPLTAFLLTRFPTKGVYMGGIGCFLVGLLLSIFAGDFGWMMAGRVLQACGNGVLLSAAQVVILTVYPPDQRGARMGTYGLATTAAPILAPTLAGLMIDAFGWRSIFWLVLGVMAVSFLLSALVFANVLERQDKPFDALSFLESIVAFGGITLGVGNLSAYGLLSPATLLPLAAGVVGCLLFFTRQCRLPVPFLEVKILRSRGYRLSVVSSMVLYLVMMGSSVLMPLYVQSVMGYPAVVSGLVTLPGSVATALISPLAGRLYDRMGIRKLFLPGAAALLGSNLGMVFLDLSTPLWVAAVLNVVRNLAIGALMMPLLTWGTSFVPDRKLADASSLLTSFRTIAGSMGSAVFVGIMTAVSTRSAAAYGDGALLHGMHVAFLAMSAGALVLVALSLRAGRGQEEEERAWASSKG